MTASAPDWTCVPPRREDTIMAYRGMNLAAWRGKYSHRARPAGSGSYLSTVGTRPGHDRAGSFFTPRLAHHGAHHPGLPHQLRAVITCGCSDSSGIPRGYWRVLTPDSHRHPPDSGSCRHTIRHSARPTPPAPEAGP